MVKVEAQARSTSPQGLHPWLKKKGVDPADIQAAVAFPKLEGRGRAQRLKTLQDTAEMMGVSVMELPWSWEQIHQRVL